MLALRILEIEQVEQVSNGRHVRWHVGIATNPRIRQIVSAAVTELGSEHPVSLDELHLKYLDVHEARPKRFNKADRA